MINLANTISQGKMKCQAAAMRFFKLFFCRNFRPVPKLNSERAELLEWIDRFCVPNEMIFPHPLGRQHHCAFCGWPSRAEPLGHSDPGTECSLGHRLPPWTSFVHWFLVGKPGQGEDGLDWVRPTTVPWRGSRPGGRVGQWVASAGLWARVLRACEGPRALRKCPQAPGIWRASEKPPRQVDRSCGKKDNGLYFNWKKKKNFTGAFFLLFEQGALCFHFALGRASEGAGSASHHYSWVAIQEFPGRGLVEFYPMTDFLKKT